MSRSPIRVVQFPLDLSATPQDLLRQIDELARQAVAVGRGARRP
jgi:hypothetical protein